MKNINDVFSMLLNNSTKNIKNNYILYSTKCCYKHVTYNWKKLWNYFLVRSLRCCFRPWYRLSRIKTWNVNFYWKTKWNVNLRIPTNVTVEAGTHPSGPPSLPLCRRYALRWISLVNYPIDPSMFHVCQEKLIERVCYLSRKIIHNLGN